jgi:hypothetical protein
MCWELAVAAGEIGGRRKPVDIVLVKRRDIICTLEGVVGVTQARRPSHSRPCSR